MFSHLTYPREYAIFQSARNRCENPNNPSFKHYGGRGIKFLFSTYSDMFDHVGPKPTSKHSIDRINNDGHYEVGNVKWSTRTEQTRNKRNSVLISYNNKSQTLLDWSKDLCISIDLLSDRLKQGYPVAEVLGFLPLSNCKKKIKKLRGKKKTKGSNHLSKEIVLKIASHKNSNESCTEIARKYNLKFGLVWNILHGKTFSSITGITFVAVHEKMGF